LPISGTNLRKSDFDIAARSCVHPTGRLKKQIVQLLRFA
jgi:hypothetical protein